LANLNTYIKEIRKYLTIGRSMEALRISSFPEDKMRCNDTMYDLKPKIDNLIKRGESFPMSSAYLSARTAAGHLKLCTTCSESLAPSECEMVENDIKEALRYLREEKSK
jgi:hypothetical protein